MRFDELYEKYLSGECTEEEKRFVEGELAKAMIVNETVNGQRLELKPADDEKVQKVKKKFGVKMLLCAVVVTLILLLVVTGAVLGGVFGTAVGAAKNSDALGMDNAEARAIDFAYAYLTENGYFAGEKSALIVTEREKDFKMTTPLKKSVYYYEYEIKADVYELDIEINSATGECKLKDFDTEDYDLPAYGANATVEKDIGFDIAKTKAIDCAYNYLVGRGYTEDKSTLTVIDSERELKKTAFGNAYYVYEFEIIAGLNEVEVDVNGRTEDCIVTDFKLRQAL